MTWTRVPSRTRIRSAGPRSLTGGRSAAMTDLLTATGLDAYSVTGGTTAWIASGRDVATGTQPR